VLFCLFARLTLVRCARQGNRVDGLPVPGIVHRHCPDTVVDNAVVDNAAVDHAMVDHATVDVDGPLEALARARGRDSRCRPGRVRVCAGKRVIAPDVHTPTVPSTAAAQSVTPRNGESQVTDVDRSDVWPIGRTSGISALCSHKDLETA